MVLLVLAAAPTDGLLPVAPPLAAEATTWMDRFACLHVAMLPLLAGVRLRVR